MDALPDAEELLADRGYDADWFRDALLAKGITPCIPPKKNWKTPRIVQKGTLRGVYVFLATRLFGHALSGYAHQFQHGHGRA